MGVEPGATCALDDVEWSGLGMLRFPARSRLGGASGISPRDVAMARAWASYTAALRRRSGAVESERPDIVPIATRRRHGDPTA